MVGRVIGWISLLLGLIPAFFLISFLVSLFSGTSESITKGRYDISVDYEIYEELAENKLCGTYVSFVGDYIHAKQTGGNMSLSNRNLVSDDKIGHLFSSFKSEADKLPVGKNTRAISHFSALNVILYKKYYNKTTLSMQQNRFEAHEANYCYGFPKKLPFWEKQKYEFFNLFS